MKLQRDVWLTISAVSVPIFALMFAGWVNIKSDVNLLKSAKAAESRQIERMAEDVRSQGTEQAVIAQRVKSIEAQIERLEASSSRAAKEQANLLREILEKLGR